MTVTRFICLVKYIDREKNKAIDYFQLASDQNHVGAQIILGNIFYNGEFIERDIDISIHFFQLAADQDDTEALYMLGVIYSDENESYFDINQSLHYFQLAAIKGHDLSLNKVITLNLYWNFYLLFNKIGNVFLCI